MCKFRIITALSFVLLLAMGERAFAGPGAAAPGRLTARQLVRHIDSLLASAEWPAPDLERTYRGSPEYARFWNALARMRLRVSEIGAALKRWDADFFLLLDQGSADLGSLRVAWARSTIRHDWIGMKVAGASNLYRRLRANYGREGFRHRQRGGLSEAERLHFQRIQRMQRRFAESLLPLRERSRRRGDQVMVAEIDRFREEAERIARASMVLDSYLNSLIASGEMRGEWEATVPYVRSHAAEELAAVNEMVEDLYVESDIGQVFTVDLGKAGGWSYLDPETGVPAGADGADGSGAVQFYEPGADEEEAVLAEESPVPESATVEDEVAAEEEESEPELAEDLPDDEAVAEDGILEEEDLEELESPQPPADPGSAKLSPPAEEPKKDSKPAEPAPASPPIG